MAGMDKITGIYNFLPIDDSLSTSGQPSEEQIRELAAVGYEIVINLALHDDLRYSLPGEKALVEGLGMAYIHIPVRFDNPTEDDLLAFFRTMEKHENMKIHLHCAANMRVTAFLGLYRRLKQGKPENEAFEPMRSVWEPNDVWSTFIHNFVTEYTVD
jgi:protein tyrosine phosphatase (PTP) superfamily phosphohydrolase (DUF442 family)